MPRTQATTPTATYSATSARAASRPRADAVVDRVADDVPADDRRRRGDGGEREDDREAAVPALGVAPEPREPDARLAHAASASSPKSAANGPPARTSSSGRPVLDDPAVLQDDRAVGDEHRREPLAETSTVRPATAGRRCSTSSALRLGVDRRHRVVEHEHARAGDERAREGDALALAAGEVDAALADQRVVAVREVVDEAGDAGRLARVEHLAPVGVGPRGEAGCRGAGSRRGRLLRDDRDGRRSSASDTSRASTPPTRTRPAVGS